MQKKQNKIRPNLGFDFNHESPEKSELSVQTLKSEKLPSFFFSNNAAKFCPITELAYLSFQHTSFISGTIAVNMSH